MTENKKHIMAIAKTWGLKFPKKKCKSKTQSDFIGGYVSGECSAVAEKAHMAAVELLNLCLCQRGKDKDIVKHFETVVVIWDDMSYPSSVERLHDYELQIDKIIAQTTSKRRQIEKMDKDLKATVEGYLSSTIDGLTRMQADKSYTVGLLTAEKYQGLIDEVSRALQSVRGVTDSYSVDAEELARQVIGAAADIRKTIVSKQLPSPSAVNTLVRAAASWQGVHNASKRKTKPNPPTIPAAVTDPFEQYLSRAGSGLEDKIEQFRQAAAHYFAQAEATIGQVGEKVADIKVRIVQMDAEYAKLRELGRLAKQNGNKEELQRIFALAQKIQTDKARLEQELDLLAPQIEIQQAVMQTNDDRKHLIDELLSYWDMSKMVLSDADREYFFSGIVTPESMEIISNPAVVSDTELEGFFAIVRSITAQVEQNYNKNAEMRRRMQGANQLNIQGLRTTERTKTSIDDAEAWLLEDEPAEQIKTPPLEEEEDDLGALKIPTKPE